MLSLQTWAKHESTNRVQTVYNKIRNEYSQQIRAMDPHPAFQHIDKKYIRDNWILGADPENIEHGAQLYKLSGWTGGRKFIFLCLTYKGEQGGGGGVCRTRPLSIRDWIDISLNLSNYNWSEYLCAGTSQPLKTKKKIGNECRLMSTIYI